MKFFVGTYTSPEGRGAYPLTYHADEDSWVLGEPDTTVEDCSYAARDPRSGIYYLLNEGSGTIRSSDWTEQDGWHHTQDLPAYGNAPCFVAVEDDGSRIAIANYDTGYVVTYQRNTDDGTLGTPVHVYDHAGKGPNAERQDGPHAHCVRFRNGGLYSTDLGTDSVLLHQEMPQSDGAHKTTVAFQTPGGEGPRHILFHPVLPVAYLLTELGSKIFVLRVLDDGHLEMIQTLSALPAGFTGESLGGHIAINARFDKLYVSNRGHDSLAVFAISDDGAIELRQHAATHGRSPRHFYLAEDIGRVIIAHQNGHSVVIQKLEADGNIGDVKAVLSVPQAAFVGVLTDAQTA